MVDIFAICVLMFDLLFHMYMVMMVLVLCMCELGLLWPVSRQISVTCPALSIVW